MLKRFRGVKLPAKPKTGPAAARKRLLTDERGRLLLMAGGCLLLLVAAMLIPLLFRTAPSASERPVGQTPELEIKTRLFTAFWYNNGSGVTSHRETEPAAPERAFCESRAAELIARCIDDDGLANGVPTGSEYTLVTDDEGNRLRLCRTWLQARGDWQNWLDVCFDAETGMLYYLYVSRECLTNLSRYADVERAVGAALARELTESVGGRLRLYDGGDSGGAAVIETPGGILCYEIRETLYDTLIDVRINCQ